MRRWRTLFVLAVLTSAAALSAVEPQDHQTLVRDLTEGELTEEKLIEALRPKEEPPPELLGTARGIGLAARPRVRCALRESSNSRGISVRPNEPVSAAVIKIYFAFNSAEILPEAHKSLQQVARALNSESLALSCFQIVGHTDDVGSDAYNDRLSRMRATAVARYLSERLGVEPSRLESVGRGERSPMVPNTSEAGRSKNRRVEIENMGYGEPEI